MGLHWARKRSWRNKVGAYIQPTQTNLFNLGRPSACAGDRTRNEATKLKHTHTLHYTTHDIESWELGEVSLVAKGARPTSSGSEIWLDNSFGSPSLRACFWAWESTGFLITDGTGKSSCSI